MSIGKRLVNHGAMSRPMHFDNDGPWGKVNFDLFFDRNEVRSRLDRKELRVLAKTGGFTRTTVRNTIKKAGKKKGQTSAPGKPPKYHDRGPRTLKDGVFFSADLDRGGVIIGPALVRQRRVIPDGHPSGARLLEFGGMATIYRKHDSGKTRTIRRRYRARPYIQPAMPKAQAKMLELMEKVNL